MPFGVQRDDSLGDDRLVASLTLVSELFSVTFLTVGGTLNLHELGADQFALAAAAHEMVLMPVSPHCRYDFLFFVEFINFCNFFLLVQLKNEVHTKILESELHS